jgi:hypothetical protein
MLNLRIDQIGKNHEKSIQDFDLRPNQVTGKSPLRRESAKTEKTKVKSLREDPA